MVSQWTNRKKLQALVWLGIFLIAVVAITGYAASSDVLAPSRPGTVVLSVSVLAALIFFIATRWVTRSVIETLDQAIGIAERIADGDLAVHISTEVTANRRLLDALNRMAGSLRHMVECVASSAHSTLNGAAEITEGNARLSERTSQQAASLEETASSMEEMTAAVRHSADNAREASRVAGLARERARRSGVVARQAVDAMAAITQSSKKITEIVGMIEDVAFQTNLLALNAAVEAARAGEQGKGFAVVASEVRMLARRSGEAAKEIKSLITDSVQKIETGSLHVAESRDALDQIIEAVSGVADLVEDIATASVEQSNGIEQVNRAVMQMDTVTQHNAALVEEAEAASRALREQAHALLGLVGRFRMGERPSPTHGVAHPKVVPSVIRRPERRPSITLVRAASSGT